MLASNKRRIKSSLHCEQRRFYWQRPIGDESNSFRLTIDHKPCWAVPLSFDELCVKIDCTIFTHLSLAGDDWNILPDWCWQILCEKVKKPGRKLCVLAVSGNLSPWQLTLLVHSLQRTLQKFVWITPDDYVLFANLQKCALLHELVIEYGSPIPRQNTEQLALLCYNQLRSIRIHQTEIECDSLLQLGASLSLEQIDVKHYPQADSVQSRARLIALRRVLVEDLVQLKTAAPSQKASCEQKIAIIDRAVTVLVEWWRSAHICKRSVEKQCTDTKDVPHNLPKPPCS
jgi:hypothetical protein